MQSFHPEKPSRSTHGLLRHYGAAHCELIQFIAVVVGGSVLSTTAQKHPGLYSGVQLEEEWRGFAHLPQAAQWENRFIATATGTKKDVRVLRVQAETWKDLKTCHVPLSPDLTRSKPRGGGFQLQGKFQTENILNSISGVPSCHC